MTASASPTTDAPPAPVFSVVVPMFNEADGILLLHARLAAVMDAPRRTVGGRLRQRRQPRRHPAALSRPCAQRDPRVAVVNLSRNFGKEIATTAGLDHAGGDAVIVIDADLQDPPEVIPDLVAAWRRGLRHGLRPAPRADGETWLKTRTASLFYRLMRNWGQVELPPDTGDFRLMSRRAVDALLKLREQHRFMKGLFAWVGFPSKPVLYDRAPRAAGETKWSWWKLWNLAIEGFTSFSVLPLKLATYLGVAVALVAALFGVVVVVRTLVWGDSPAGYPSLLVVVLLARRHAAHLPRRDRRVPGPGVQRNQAAPAVPGGALPAVASRRVGEADVSPLAQPYTSPALRGRGRGALATRVRVVHAAPPSPVSLRSPTSPAKSGRGVL